MTHKLIYKLILAGCTPCPMAAYLKGLGVLRLVAEQADPAALGCWHNERFVLESLLDREALLRFLLYEYRPTPILAPWSGDSGFYKRNKAWRKGVAPLLQSDAERFTDYRLALALARQAVTTFDFKEDSPKDSDKARFLRHLRAELPERALAWLDAAVLLTDGEPKNPPLLGSGGNDGRLDFTSAFMQRLLEVLDPQGRPRRQAATLLAAALFAEPAAGLSAETGGQFAPGSVEAPSGTTGFWSKALVNPWDIILTLEGALPFAAAATRRLETTDNSTLSYPFTLRSTAAGAGSIAAADESQARAAEMWLPLWANPADLAEVRAFLAEGRLTLGRRSARDGLDAARTVVALGVDRGLSAFQRYSFLMRSGRAFLAIPLNRIPVQRNVQADLIADLDRNGWLDALNRVAKDKQTPARLVQSATRLKNALFRLTRVSDAESLQAVLIALGVLQRDVAVSPKLQQYLPPIPMLRSDWIERADDASHEFRLAVALASLYSPELPMLAHLAPVVNGRWAVDQTGGTRRVVWGNRGLCENLVRVLNRRLLEAGRQDKPQDKPLAGRAGADLAAVAAFLRSEVNEQRLAALLQGLVCVRLPDRLPRRTSSHRPVPGAYAFLKPLFTPDHTLQRLGILPAERGLPIPAGLVSQLTQGSREALDRALRLAERRARGSGLPLLGAAPSAQGLDGTRLAAALLIPLDTVALRRLLARAYPLSADNTISADATAGIT